MAQNRSNRDWKLGLVSAIAMSGVLASSQHYAFADIRSDATLEAETLVQTTKLSKDTPSNQIEKNKANCGVKALNIGNFFVPTTRSIAYFSKTTDHQKIINRINDWSISNIDGTFRTQDSLNLFPLASHTKFQFSDTNAVVETKKFMQAFPKQGILVACDWCACCGCC